MQKRRYTMSPEAYFKLIERNKARAGAGSLASLSPAQRREYNRLATRKSRKLANERRAAFLATLHTNSE